MAFQCQESGLPVPRFPLFQLFCKHVHIYQNRSPQLNPRSQDSSLYPFVCVCVCTYVLRHSCATAVLQRSEDDFRRLFSSSSLRRQGSLCFCRSVHSSLVGCSCLCVPSGRGNAGITDVFPYIWLFLYRFFGSNSDHMASAFPS